MNTQNNKTTIHQHIRYSIFFGPFIVGLIAAMLSFCPLASAETYEVIEDGQVYFIEVVEEVVAASKKDKDPNDISGQYDKIHENLSKLLDTASKSKNIFSNKQIDKFNKYKNENSRSKKAKDRFHKNGGFEKVGRENDFNKGNKDNPDKIDKDAYNELDESLEDLNLILIDAEQDVRDANEIKGQYMALRILDVPDKCKDLVDASTALRISAAALKGYAIYCQAVLDGCSAISGQDIAGFNFQAACAIPAVVVGAVELAATGCDTADQWISSDLEAACMDQIDNRSVSTYDEVLLIGKVTKGTAADVNDLAIAVEELNEALKDLNDRMDDLEKRIDDKFAVLNAKLDVKFDYIQRLLKMPQGKREDFPLKEQ